MKFSLEVHFQQGLLRKWKFLGYHLTNFVQIYRAYVKEILSSELGELFWKKKSFYWQKLMKNGLKIWKKKFLHQYNTFLHKSCKFKHNRSSSTRDILTTLTPRFLDIFT